MSTRIATALLAGGLTMGATAASAAEGATTERVSVGPGGVQSPIGGYDPAISADGRFVGFVSRSGNLAPGDTNEIVDVYVRDRQRDTTERVSVATGGGQAAPGDEVFGSSGPSLSADGRFVAFVSDAANLVPGDTNDTDDVFVRDRRAGTTELVSVGRGGAAADLGTGTRVTSISADGRFVAFESAATNLVPGDTNGNRDVFVRDRQTGRTERVSIGPGGAQGNDSSDEPAISADGRFVAFTSSASTLVRGDTNGEADVFVRDRVAGTTERVSVGRGGAQANEGTIGPSISADGRFVALASGASNLVPGDTNGRFDVFVRDRQRGTTERANVSSSEAQVGRNVGLPSISADGRYVAFSSTAKGLVRGDTNGLEDVFVRDRQGGTTERVNLGPGGVQAGTSDGFGDFGSRDPAISADGRSVAFVSGANNLVPDDTNRFPDVFVRTR